MGRDDGTDRALVRGVISVTAHVAENRTDVQTCAAANAMQGVTLFSVRQQTGAAVVQQHDVKFLRAVGFTASARAGDKRVVACQRLTGAARGQHRPEQREVF